MVAYLVYNVIYMKYDTFYTKAELTSENKNRFCKP